MKVKARVDDRDTELTLTIDESRVFATVDGRKYELEFHRREDGSYLVLKDGQVFDCRVNRTARKENFAVAISDRSYSVGISDPRRLRGANDTGDHHHGSAEILAPMPGKVVRVMVEVGSQIEKGKGVVIVEAMKMQNEMKSPREGSVKAVNVKPGDTVNAGDVLAIVE
ncbi:MAG TPA: biotin/lipoyl-containing protein [Pyrinomonadaceae bacterium]|nr:biotin/lipoyl-containing protein [Pyrinomonadaceae bacterium]